MPHYPLYHVACSPRLSSEVICTKFYFIVDSLYHTTTTTTLSFVGMTITILSHFVVLHCLMVFPNKK